MNEDLKGEVEELKRRQRELNDRLSCLEARIGEMPTEEKISSPPRVEPPPLPEFLRVEVPPEVTEQPQTPKPEPPPVPRAFAKGDEIHAEEEVVKESLEMRIGTHWFVRLGVVFLLTAAGLLGSYAYAEMGAAGKLGLIFTGSMLAVGLGWGLSWWKKNLENFGEVLAAGGLAGGYFGIYAAHFVESLRVTDNGLLVGLCLFLWAGGMIWLAVRKDSQTLGTLAILLAFYSSTLQEVTYFTLGSNVLLALAAVGLFLKKRWTGVTFVAVLGTYGSVAVWQYFYDGFLHGGIEPGGAEFWMGTVFLTIYFALFTAAAFFAKSGEFSGTRRATLVTLNNLGFYGLMALWMDEAGGRFCGYFTLVMAGVCLGLGLAVGRQGEGGRFLRETYRVHGFLLIVLGFLLTLSGNTLALVFAGMSLILVLRSRNAPSRVLDGAALAVGLVSVMAGYDFMNEEGVRSLLFGTALAGLFLFNAKWMRIGMEQRGRERLSLRVATFSFYAMCCLVFTVTANTELYYRAPLILFLGMLFTWSVYGWRVKEVTIVSQGVVLLAHLIWFSQLTRGSVPWWNPLAVVALTVVLSAWWETQHVFGRNAMVAVCHYFYRVVAFMGYVFGIFEYIPERERVWVFLLSGAVLFVWGAWQRVAARMILGGLFSFLGLMIYWMVWNGQERLYFMNLAGIFLLFTQQQVGGVLLNEKEFPRWVQRGVIFAGLATLWWYVTLAVRYEAILNDSRTVAWALLALAVFGASFPLREKTYRHAALGILALALMRFAFVDFWEFEITGQILGAAVLGGVMVLLGFLYNRFHEAVRKLL